MTAQRRRSRYRNNIAAYQARRRAGNRYCPNCGWGGTSGEVAYHHARTGRWRARVPFRLGTFNIRAPWHRSTGPVIRLPKLATDDALALDVRPAPPELRRRGIDLVAYCPDRIHNPEPAPDPSVPPPWYTPDAEDRVTARVIDRNRRARARAGKGRR